MEDKDETDGIISSNFVFRSTEYVVSMEVLNESLILEVEDRLTSDQWRNTFDAAYIEDLTHKTGNFKQFNVFTNMLESALKKTSESVTLDLLTYSDLETLRSKKSGLSSRNVPPAKKASLSTKRYLIVTYTVEFDRIHYPMPLPYQGKPDPVALQETVRNLKEEVKALQKQLLPDFRNAELNRLRKECEGLKRDKEELETAFLQYRREVKNTAKGSAAKEIRILKSVVKNLEEEIMHAKTKHQREIGKRNQDIKNLVEEVEELKASERNLRARVKSLTNELSVIKRGRGGSSRGRSPAIPSSRQSSGSKRKSLTTQERARSQSREGRAGSRGAGQRQSRSQSRERSRSVNSVRSRSPSPAGARNPRFDPTAYVQDKKRREKETQLKMDRRRQSGVGGGGGRRSSSMDRASRNRARPSPLYPDRRWGYRSSSVNSQGSRHSSVASLSDIEALPDAEEVSRSRSRNLSRGQKRGHSSAASHWISPDIAHRRGRQASGSGRKFSTPDPDRHYPERRVGAAKNQGRSYARLPREKPASGENSLFNRSVEMSEIDARLNALQQFMKNMK